MKKQRKGLAHRVLVSIQVECEVGAPNAMSIIKNLQVGHILKTNNKIHDVKFLLIKKQTEPFTQEEIDEAYSKRRQEAIVSGE